MGNGMTEQQSGFLAFDELFARIGVLGHELSARLTELDGQEVTMHGYLARFGHHDSAVLTPQPVTLCSDCGGSHDLPETTVFIFPADQRDFPQGEVTVSGVLEHGPLRIDGANSLIRLREARWQL